MIQVFEGTKKPGFAWDMTAYFDENGFLCHYKVDDADQVIRPIQFDGGDSLMRIGVWLKMKNLLGEAIKLENNGKIEGRTPRGFYMEFIDPFIIKMNLKTRQFEPTRHWNENEWFGKVGTMSRDNFLPILCFALETGMWGWARLRWYEVESRYFMLWNVKKIGQQSEKEKIPDFLGASGFALFARILYPDGWPSRLHLWTMKHLADSILVGSALVKVIGSYLDKENTGDTLNLSNVLDTLSRNKPTIQSRLAAWILKRFLRRHDKFPHLTPVQSHWAEYFMREEAPPLDQLVIRTEKFIFNK